MSRVFVPGSCASRNELPVPRVRKIAGQVVEKMLKHSLRFGMVVTIAVATGNIVINRKKSRSQTSIVDWHVIPRSDLKRGRRVELMTAAQW